MPISVETGRFAVTENDGATVRSRYQHSDHPGSSHLETDGSGAVISHEEHHPFDTTAYQATHTSLGPAARRYRFCGKERDEESGLYYYGARYYASWLGRFVSVDPKESKYFFQSSYAYAENSPVTKMDWNGEGTGEEKPKIETNFEANGLTNPSEAGKTYSKGSIVENKNGSWTWDGNNWLVNTPGKESTVLELLKLNGLPSSSEINQWETERLAEIERYYSTPQTVTLKDPASLPSSTLKNPSSSEDYIQFEGSVPKRPEFRLVRTLATGQVDPNYTLESIFIPIPKGTVLFGRGTGLMGAIPKSTLNMKKLGGASDKINYYTQKAIESGFSTSITGHKIKSVLFVQINHNLNNILAGKKLKVLFSQSQATIMGRKWQNQAIGLGSLNLSIGTYSTLKSLQIERK